MDKLKVPNVVLGTLLVAAAWFVNANWPHEPWYNLVIIVILAVLKGLQTGLEDKLPLPPAQNESAPPGAMGLPRPVAAGKAYVSAFPSAAARWLVG